MRARIILFCPTAMDCRGFNIHISFHAFMLAFTEPVNDPSKQESMPTVFACHGRACLYKHQETQQYKVFAVIEEARM